MDTETVILPPSLPSPHSALVNSYTYHSPKPSTSGSYVLGVDEAGRGPVLGPLVYGVAYCPLDFVPRLETMGFADSKTLTSSTRETLLATLSSDPANLGWSVRIISPQDISGGMLRRPPINLNRQSEEATVLLIREVIASGVNVSEVYVDALGPSVPYQAYLSSLFPTLSITVCPKADSIYTIVGAASVAAKVTRDAWVEEWMFDEVQIPISGFESAETDEVKGASQPPPSWATSARGSGYPSDPKTQAWLKSSIDPAFGFPGLARFSWATVKVMLENDAHSVKWTDEGQGSLIKAFESVTTRDKGRSVFAKELRLKSMSDL